MEEYNVKLYHVKIDFFLSKDVINKVKKQTAKCDNIGVTDKGCVFRYVKAPVCNL